MYLKRRQDDHPMTFVKRLPCRLKKMGDYVARSLSARVWFKVSSWFMQRVRRLNQTVTTKCASKLPFSDGQMHE